MKSSFINKESYTSQVVKVMEREIRSGALPPLSRLQSVRELAQRFDVSLSVIVSALNELEKQKLIYREPRRGVFVSSTASNPEVAEAFLLVFGSPTPSLFFERLLSVISSPANGGRVNFNLRTIMLNDEQFRNPECWQPLLETEFSRLRQLQHADCILMLGGDRMRQGEIRTCLGLPKPTLFLGHFPEGDFNDFEYNRLGFINGHFVPMAERIRQCGFKRIGVLTLENCMGSAHFREEFEPFAREMAGDGREVRLIGEKRARHPNGTPPEREAAIDRLLDGFDPEVVIFDTLPHAPASIALLRERGFIPVEGEREIYLDLASGSMHPGNEPGVRRSLFSAASQEALHRHLLDTVIRLAAGEFQGFHSNYRYEHLLFQ